MAVPKSKVTKARRGNRRSHDSLPIINSVECSNCGAIRLMHHVCSSCGHYGSKNISGQINKETD